MLPSSLQGATLERSKSFVVALGVLGLSGFGVVACSEDLEGANRRLGDVGSPSPEQGEEDAGTDLGVVEATLDLGSSDLGSFEAPVVSAEALYPVAVSTQVYGVGLRHSEWGGGTTEAMDLLVDVFQPEGAPPGRPALVCIHGGGFTGGSRRAAQMLTFAEYFAERGWVAISIDYRKVQDRGTVSAAWLEYVDRLQLGNARDQGLALYPAARDAKAAIRWLNAEAEALQLDQGYITVLGGSAGSFLAIMLGVSEPEDFRDEIDLAEDPTLSSTHLNQPAVVHTVIDHWGGLAHLEALEALDGRSRFDESDAPVSIVHGTQDRTVAFSEAEALRDAYMQTGVPFAFHPLEGAGHGPWSAEVNGMSLPELAFEFVVEQQALQVSR